jgi:hypothetical protein
MAEAYPDKAIGLYDFEGFKRWTRVKAAIDIAQHKPGDSEP